MTASQTDFIKFLVNDSIKGIEEDLVRHFQEKKDYPILVYCGDYKPPVKLYDLTFEQKREWIITKASGKNNKDRLKFVKLCNSIKDRKLKEMESLCTRLDKDNTKFTKIFLDLKDYCENKIDRKTIIQKIEEQGY